MEPLSPNITPKFRREVKLAGFPTPVPKTFPGDVGKSQYLPPDYHYNLLVDRWEKISKPGSPEPDQQSLDLGEDLAVPDPTQAVPEFLGGATLVDHSLEPDCPLPELKPDMVNHPPHYTAADNGIECIDAIRAALGKEMFIGFLRGQVIKYHWRLLLKTNPLEDLRKASWYAKKLEDVLSEHLNDSNLG